MPRQSRSLPLRRSLCLVTTGGSLAMVYVAGVLSPLQTDFFRALGASDFHFGLLGGVPLATVFLQFVGAVLARRLRTRKPIFIVMLVLSRLVYLLIAFMPLLFPGLRGTRAMVPVVALVALSGIVMNVASPLWFSWMADLVPRRVLNSYWGVRQRIMFMVLTAATLFVAAYTWLLPLSPFVTYPILATASVAAGIVDILLFVRVVEPEHVRAADRSPLQVLAEPFLRPDYRRMLIESCYRSGSLTLAAVFMGVYVLKGLKLPVWQLTVMFAGSQLGNALTARAWGRIADRYGCRPVLRICVACKPVIVVVLAFVPRELAIWVMPIAFLVDGAWNAGMTVAGNGLMIKLAPRENRSMFIAAITGLSGVVAGVASIAGGHLLEVLAGRPLAFAGRAWQGYHVVFLISFVLRVINAWVVSIIREPRSAPSVQVLSEIWGTWPQRLLRFPVGLYQQWDGRA